MIANASLLLFSHGKNVNGKQFERNALKASELIVLPEALVDLMAMRMLLIIALCRSHEQVRKKGEKGGRKGVLGEERVHKFIS